MKPCTRSGLVSAAVLGLALTEGCTLFVDQRERAVSRLAETGPVVARWDVREEDRRLTHTFVLVGSGQRYHLWDIMSGDGYRSVQQEQAGGIEAGGCFLFWRGTAGVGPLRMKADGRIVQDLGRVSTNQRIPTTCEEYDGTPAAPIAARLVKHAAR